jgi:basic amino acid/polyamine antiporter, APA family
MTLRSQAITTAPDSGLLRVVGRWDMVALVINGIVGAGIFGLPAKVHALLGAWGVLAIVACAAMMALIVLCFAEVSSRFTQTGGPYVYAAEAFGPFTAFIVGWLHVRGTRGVTRFSGAITSAKLAPLLLFVAVGLPAIDWHRVSFETLPTRASFSSGVLLLGFALVGWENAAIAAGEVRDPRRDTPFALFVGLALVVALYVGIQVVCAGTLPALASSKRPLADAALQFMGPVGATLIVGGAAVSILGTINAGILAISRIPFAMAEASQLPGALAKLHPVYRTPVLSIAISCISVLLLTLTRGHIYLLTISTISRLFVFAVTIAALPIFRRRPTMPPALFTLPGGMSIPLVALASIVWLLSGTSLNETRDVVIATVAGGLIYLVTIRKNA